MSEENQEEILTLAGQEAIDLWLQGGEVWNEWVEENPVYNVDFSGTDFSKYRKHYEDEVISFQAYEFPAGGVYFTDVNFGKGGVYFIDTNFGEGDVDFSGVKFGKGDVNFSSTKFGKGNVNFGFAEFCEGDVEFWFAQFDEGDVDFSNATFSKVVVNFSHVRFNKNNIFFRKANFSESNILFTEAIFDKGLTSFYHSKFDESSIDFSGATLNVGPFLFEKIEFNGHVDFSNLIDSHLIETLSFKHSSFKKSFDLSRNYFNCIPDLTNTSMSNQISLSKLIWTLRWKLKYSFAIAIDPDDAERLRRLKDIATNNNDHALALRAHADEMRAKRWNNGKNFSSVLDLIFDKICHYGQSIIRPFIGFFSNIILFALFYTNLGKPTSEFFSFSDHFQFSLASSFPLISVSGKVKDAGYEMFETTDLPFLYGLMTAQGVISFIFLFLIGLGLRNKFRL